jgi:uncharacterized protein YeaO (DUF488 family)
MGVITLARVHDDAATGGGPRFLVERLWPRGVRRADLQLDEWVKDVAPSDELRRWFGHDPEKWDEFRRRYFAELDGRPQAWAPLRDAAAAADVTFLYSSRDAEHNNAVALREYVTARLTEGAPHDRRSPADRAGDGTTTRQR